jgi:hypothetical protein
MLRQPLDLSQEHLRKRPTRLWRTVRRQKCFWWRWLLSQLSRRTRLQLHTSLHGQTFILCEAARVVRHGGHQHHHQRQDRVRDPQDRHCVPVRQSPRNAGIHEVQHATRGPTRLQLLPSAPLPRPQDLRLSL